jgi:hypothetical protein
MVWIRAPSWRLRSPARALRPRFAQRLPCRRVGHGRDHLLVEPIDQRRSQVFRARFARVAALAFLETATHRRLAAADLAIALCLGDGAPAILANTRRTDAKRRSDGFRVSLRVPCHTIDSAGNLRARYWSEGTFRRGRVQKRIFYPEFPGAAGKGRGGATAVVGPFGVAAGSVIVASFFKGVARDRQRAARLGAGRARRRSLVGRARSPAYA